MRKRVGSVDGRLESSSLIAAFSFRNSKGKTHFFWRVKISVGNVAIRSIVLLALGGDASKGLFLHAEATG
jgi:hypothetical protein